MSYGLGQPVEIDVKGTGLGLPKIGVYQADGSKLKEGVAIGFGSGTVKSDGSTKTITIKNQGSVNLSGLKISKSGGANADFLISPLGRTSLGPSATTTFKVTFHPTARKGLRRSLLRPASRILDCKL